MKEVISRRSAIATVVLMLMGGSVIFGSAVKRAPMLALICGALLVSFHPDLCPVGRLGTRTDIFRRLKIVR